jgi:hypothetical protein
MVYLARKANLANFEGDSLVVRGISALSGIGTFGARGVLGCTVSDDIKCISDNEVAVTSLGGIGFGGIVCDRSIIVLKRGEITCNNPFEIFESSIGTSFYNN